MVRSLFALCLFSGLLGVAGPALGQTDPAQAPIVCNVEDHVEDAACRTKLKGMFTRKGDTLTLALEGGKSKSYVGNLAACDGENVDVAKCMVFSVKTYFPRIQSYLIERGLYECGNVLLVSRRTGSETAMSEIPVLSPNAQYLLSIDQSDACDRNYDIAVWSTQSDPPKLEFKYKAKRYENWEVKVWESDTQIRMKAWINDKASYDQEALLVRNDSGWTLKLGRKTEHKN